VEPAHAGQVEVDLDLQREGDVRLVGLHLLSGDAPALSRAPYVRSWPNRRWRGGMQRPRKGLCESYLQQLGGLAHV
jgi:hypothetical protein